MNPTYRIVHYLNQFFGGIGGEEKADACLLVREGSVGPGKILEGMLKGQGRIISTLICGDNYFQENTELVVKQVVDEVAKLKADIFLAGPAFNAGRYGLACGELCATIQQQLGVTSVTGMYPENAAAALYRDRVLIAATGEGAAGMQEALEKMVQLALKLHFREPLGPARLEGYIPRGVRKNLVDASSGGERAVAMLLAKLKGERYESEIPLPAFEWVQPAPPLADLRRACIAMITTGGIVPQGNPDRLTVGRSTKWGKYSLVGFEDLTKETHQCQHAGYGVAWTGGEDPDRIVPLDGMRLLEKEGVIGKLHDYFYSTSGQGTYVENARRMGTEIAADLLAAEVAGAILTST